MYFLEKVAFNGNISYNGPYYEDLFHSCNFV